MTMITDSLTFCRRRDWENRRVTQLNRLARHFPSPAGVMAKGPRRSPFPTVAQPEWRMALCLVSGTGRAGKLR
ncbi:hypothetical protein ACVXG8_11580 [Escherichia coli]